MLKFILQRVASGIALLFVISLLAFLLLYFGAGDIAHKLVGQDATPEMVAAKKHELGLDRPIFEQYLSWLGNALSGNFGTSWFTGERVQDAVSSRIAVTLSLVIGTAILVVIIAVTLGVLAAVRRGWVDRLVNIIAVLGFAVPGFLIALGLVMVFAISLGWFQATGYIKIDESLGGWLSTVTLPIIALSFAGIAGVSQQVRGSVIDVLRQDYVRTLRSRGISERRVVFKHVLRNALTPALTVLSLQFVALIGGAVIVEQIFAIPGLGQVAVQATSQGDIPMVMGMVVTVAALVVVINMLVDLANGWLNPKVRLA